MRRGDAINLSNRVRRSPFFEATLAAGAQDFTIYNHMWMPTLYASAEEDYRALTERVTLWDTAAERQVEIRGPGAEDFVRRLTPRNLDRWTIGQCKYLFLCDETGGIINDPVGLKLAENHIWLSLADGDILHWVKGLALGWGLELSITEPDVSPLQVQGPRATEVMEAVIGPSIRDLKFFRFMETEIDGAPVVISRTGWSNERGYEIFLRDGRFGNALWGRFMAAGEPLGVAPGAPNQANRIEAGMLSYGADMDCSNTPFEIGLGRFVDLSQEVDFIGKAALAETRDKGPDRVIVGLRIGGEALPSNTTRDPVFFGTEKVGEVTSRAFSARAGANIALAYLRPDLTEPRTRLSVDVGDRHVDATVHSLPFIVTDKRA